MKVECFLIALYGNVWYMRLTQITRCCFALFDTKKPWEDFRMNLIVPFVPLMPRDAGSGKTDCESNE